jgi:hypothetical protein
MKLSSQFGIKSGASLSLTPPQLKANVLFCMFSKISPGFRPNSGYWCRVFLTLRKTLMNV